MAIIVNSFTQKRREYWHAGVKFYRSGESKPFNTVVYPEPFVNVRTARKHAEIAAHELRAFNTAKINA